MKPAVSLLLVAVLVSLAAAPPAWAQDEGVTIDPNSPSAKEYAIPLEAERRQADPTRAADDRIEQGSRSAPLFGAGIEPAESARRNAATPSGPRPATDTRRTRRGSPRPPLPQAAAADVLRARSNPGAPSGGADSALIIAAVAAIVLGLGGATGVVLRRRRS